MRHFCTLFDHRYLPQGLALYESLLNHSSEPFMLHVLAMDREAEDVLRSLNYESMEVWGFVKLNRLEGSEAHVYRQLQSEPADWLLRSGGPPIGTDRLGMFVDESRTQAELCWTLASQLSEWMLGWIYPGGEAITYLDADLYFYADPRVIFDEIGNRSIGVIPHRIVPSSSNRHTLGNGKFNVSLVHFKNTPVGRECLSTWAAQVRKRCSAEVGCGDQKYLDEFPVRYGEECCIVQNIGAGVAPWNVANYEVSEGPKVDGKDVVFAHYHEYIHHKRLTNYQLRPQDCQYIYEPYIAAVNRAEEQITVNLAEITADPIQ